MIVADFRVIKQTLEFNTMKIAVIGGTSNIVDPDTQIKLSKDDSLIIDAEAFFIIDETETAVSPYIERWAKERGVAYISEFCTVMY